MADINKTWQTAFQPLRTERARLDRHSTARARAVNERVLVPVAVDSPRRSTGAMNAIDERACGKPGCDNFGKPGLNIVGHGWFVTKSGRGVVAQIKCEVERDPDETGGMKSRVHPKYKTKYRVRNWASYERALIGRGNITIWLSSTLPSDGP